jgi:hypothetical protein
LQRPSLFIVQSDKNNEHINFQKGENKMFKLLIAAVTSLSLMFGAAGTVTSQPGEALYNVKEWSVQSWNRIQQQAPSVDVLPTEEPLQTQTRDQTQDQLCDPTVDTLCEPIQDQLQDQAQDQLRQYQDAATDPLHLNPNSYGSGDGDGICDSDCTPAAEPGQHGNGH